MDFNLNQWRKNQEKNESSENEKSRLVLDLDSFSSCYSHSVSDSGSSSDCSALPLFVSEPTNKLSAFTVSADSTISATRFSSMGNGYFSLAQWQELELQALIYKHMLVGAPIPHELLYLIKKSLINSSPYYNLPQQYHHYQQARYWGRTSMDAEPGRCRRTDGKKWRCSRGVVSGHKYCERHVHRGRNRSRKHVEIPTTTTPRGCNAATNNRGGGEVLRVNPTMGSHGGVTPQFALSGHATSIDLLHLNQRPSESKKGPTEAQNDGKSNGQILRHFFDDSATSLSISMPGNPSSDVSLKLSTGDRHSSDTRVNNVERSMWGTNQVSSMGGPLAEALRSSMSNSSPTSVLHHLPRGSTSEACYIST